VTSSRPPLAGQAALVTGAGGDIGAAIAESLGALGAAVGLVGRTAAPLGRAGRRLPPGRSGVFATDLTSDARVRATVRSFLRRFGRLDVLVHSNGIYRAAPLEDARAGDFDRLWAANVRGPFVLTKAVLPALRDSAGQIVFVNSTIGLDTRPGVGQFSATQHALRALADTLRAELEPDGIRVFSVYPSRTATTRQERIFRQEGRPYRPERLLRPEEVAAAVAESIAAPRTTPVGDLRIGPVRPQPR
jgi:NAD(P)-dependent dehydrogenase (short-subunit alcohol dehydrogenase family)